MTTHAATLIALAIVVALLVAFDHLALDPLSVVGGVVGGAR